MDGYTCRGHQLITGVMSSLVQIGHQTAVAYELDVHVPCCP